MHLRLTFAQKAILTLAAVGMLHAQSTEAERFDVASVRPHVFGSGLDGPSCANGSFVARGMPLIIVIRWAYDLNQDQLRDMQQRLPNWMFPGGGTTSSLAYDIQAKSERRLTESQCKAGLQALLADRFKLAVHWESKESEISDLVVARGGPKMRKAIETDQGSGFAVTIDGRPVANSGGGGPTGYTMQELADFLSFIRPHQPVIDKTGLEGRYMIALKFSIQPPGSEEVFEDPDLGAALQRQLGLKLETHKGTVKTFVVDHIERPSAN